MSTVEAGALPDPLTADDEAEFVDRLRELRVWAGEPSLRRLRELAGVTVDDRGRARDALPVSTISHVLRGNRLPRMRFVESYVAACLASRQRAGDELAKQLERWCDAWRGVRRRTSSPAAPGPSAVAAPVPRQLPAGAGGFTGRTSELALLVDALSGALRTGPAEIASVHGPGGIGKSTLAVQAAHRLAGRFVDGQLYVDLRGATIGLTPLEPVDVLARFLHDLGFRGAVPSRVDDAAALLRSHVAGRRVLFLLDNAADEAQVAPLLPGSAGCAVLVTSRRALSRLTGVRHVHLDVLPAPEAVDLLGRVAGDERVAADPAAAAEVAQLCGHLPLALRIAGARLAVRRGWPVRALADRLAKEHRRLDELELTDASVRASFAVSYRQLRDSDSGSAADPVAAGAFALLGTWQGVDVSVPSAARLLDRPELEAELLMERLVDAGLLETSSPGRYRLHDLLRLYAGEQATLVYPEPARLAALARTLRFYAATAWHTLSMLRPGDRRHADMDPRLGNDGLAFADPPAALRWLEAERANLMTAVTVAAAGGELGWLAIQIAQALFGFFLSRGYWRDWEQVSRIAITVAARTGDDLASAHAYNHLGISCTAQGRYDEALACHRRSLAIYQSQRDRLGEASSLANLGVAHHKRQERDQGLRCQNESLAIHRELGYRRGQATGLNNLGMAYGEQGRYEQAKACFQEALEIYQELADPRAQAITLTNLAEVYQLERRHAEALDTAQRGLALSRRIRDRWTQDKHLALLGTIHSAQDRHRDALACYRECLAISRELGSRHDEAEALRRIGGALAALGRLDDARSHWRRALAIYEDLRLPAAGELRLMLERRPAGS